jgi:phosphoribosylglycinamide formyltransferase-1
VADVTARLVVLVSGAGTNLQALLDACADDSYGAAVVAVGSDRTGIEGVARAQRAGIPVFTHLVADHPARAGWDRALARSCARYQPDLVISAGFMKLVGQDFLDRFAGRFVNTHPSLLPAFAGMHAVRDALGYGVKVTGCTVFLVDAGTDTGPVIAQAAVPVREDDDVASLHERIKVTERALLVDTVGRMVRDGWTVRGRTVQVGRAVQAGGALPGCSAVQACRAVQAGGTLDDGSSAVQAGSEEAALACAGRPGMKRVSE